MNFQLIEIQKELSEEERIVFNYKFSHQKKSIGLYGFLAFFFGGLGAHKFYFGQIRWGIIYFIFSWSLIPSIVSIIETFFSRNRVNDQNLLIAQEIYEEIKLLR